jgi:hypothetical protein
MSRGPLVILVPFVPSCPGVVFRCSHRCPCCPLLRRRESRCPCDSLFAVCACAVIVLVVSVVILLLVLFVRRWCLSSPAPSFSLLLAYCWRVLGELVAPSSLLSPWYPSSWLWAPLFSLFPVVGAVLTCVGPVVVGFVVVVVFLVMFVRRFCWPFPVSRGAGVVSRQMAVFGVLTPDVTPQPGPPGNSLVDSGNIHAHSCWRRWWRRHQVVVVAVDSGL